MVKNVLILISCKEHLMKDSLGWSNPCMYSLKIKLTNYTNNFK